MCVCVCLGVCTHNCDAGLGAGLDGMRGYASAGVCVCVRVRVFRCVYAQPSCGVGSWLGWDAWICICRCVYMFACVYVYVCAHNRDAGLGAGLDGMREYASAGVCVCACVYVCVYVCVHVCAYVFVYVCRFLRRCVFVRVHMDKCRSSTHVRRGALNS